MGKILADMTMSEAITKAFELFIYAKYEKALNPGNRKPFQGTFEEYFDQYIHEEFFYVQDQYYDEVLEKFISVDRIENLDNRKIWEAFHGSAISIEREGWSAKVEEAFGGEGHGENYYLVISVSDENSKRYFRRDGYYTSYGDGGSLDAKTEEVKPVERLVTFYE